MEMKEIQKKLRDLYETDKPFYPTIIPGAKLSYGTRLPNLRKLAKEIAKGEGKGDKSYKQFLKDNPKDTFELEMLQAFVIGYAKDDIYEILEEFKNFIPEVHDWAVNDALCQNFKISRKYPSEVFDMLMKYKASKEEYEVRIVAVTLMSHFLNDEYIDRVIEVLDSLYAEKYYAKMGIAWAVATVMAKYPKKCMEYMKSSKLDTWTYNKSIQKMLESYRVTDEDKEILRKIKK